MSPYYRIGSPEYRYALFFKKNILITNTEFNLYPDEIINTDVDKKDFAGRWHIIRNTGPVTVKIADEPTVVIGLNVRYLHSLVRR